jgi:hypothetical protein
VKGLDAYIFSPIKGAAGITDQQGLNQWPVILITENW